MILTEKKNGKDGVQHFIGKEGEVFASCKKEIDSGGSAIVVLKNHQKRPDITQQFSKSSNITVTEINSQEDGKPGQFLCIAAYVNPGTSDFAKKAREQTIKELKMASPVFLMNFITRQ